MGLFFKKFFDEAWIDLEGPKVRTDETPNLGVGCFGAA
jgi:hypothetical protein